MINGGLDSNVPSEYTPQRSPQLIQSSWCVSSHSSVGYEVVQRSNEQRGTRAQWHMRILVRRYMISTFALIAETYSAQSEMQCRLPTVDLRGVSCNVQFQRSSVGEWHLRV